MTDRGLDSFHVRRTLNVSGRSFTFFSLPELGQALGVRLERLPVSLRILLENLLRNEDGVAVRSADIEALARVDLQAEPSCEIAFYPARVVLQDFTGVPAVVDLAAMREAVGRLGGDPERINPVFPSELVIDHSVQVDYYGTPDALRLNVKREYERNSERYALLRWAQKAFSNFRVVPPATGIVHQVNLEALGRVVFEQEGVAYPDTVVGTDSHTTMINGLGVLGWGVGGIEAEAAMLGQPINLLLPQVVGVRLTGTLRRGVTATDVVLTITKMLRDEGVVGKFVEFFGEGLGKLTLADRGTIANMAPEFGCTAALFPIDQETLCYLRQSGRSAEAVELVESYARAQGLFRDEQTPDPEFLKILSLDLGEVVPTIAGPRRPQDRVELTRAKSAWQEALPGLLSASKPKAGAPDIPVDPEAAVRIEVNGQAVNLRHGSVVIAAITSCTNTSNPSVMMAAGLLAKKAEACGLRSRPWVKTSLAPGSRVVTAYLERAGLLSSLESLGFHVVGYGCTTCIGNSGPLADVISQAIARERLVAVSVLSGNRNFEGRISPDARANFLASPPLVVAYALVGRIDIDFDSEPLGVDRQGRPVFLRDIWPSPEEISAAIASALDARLYLAEYGQGLLGDETWRSLPVPEGARFAWDPRSTYVRHPSFFQNLHREPEPLRDIEGARVLALLGDFVTTDHISPAGSIAKDSPAARYLLEQGVPTSEFNSYGARRGNHEVMMRGTFANIRLKNALVPGSEGGVTKYLPSGETMSIFDASVKYRKAGLPLVIIAGKEYGTGSSRDWAAKGTLMLGVRAVMAESFERIHRSNLIGMGVVPLQFLPGESRGSLGLTGDESFQIQGIAEGLVPQKRLSVVARRGDGSLVEFSVQTRIDTTVELEYYRHGGILPFVLRQLAARSKT
jgi:aconitate hydratase